MGNRIYCSRRHLLRAGCLGLATGGLVACGWGQPSSRISADGLERVRLGLGWRAEAEYGGYYQAVATGLYRNQGLAVIIDATPPQTNITQLLLGGVVDFAIGGALGSLKAVQQGIPLVTVAAICQREIQVLLAHPGVGHNTFAQLRGQPIFISAAANGGYWQLLKARYGFTDDQIRPYNFNISPFLADKNSAQQGLLTSEPLLIEQQGGFKPVILPLSEAGYNPYTFTIDTTRQLLDTNPDLVQRFVTASIQGWYSYLANPQPGNRGIQADNPDMTDELLAFSLAKLDEYGVMTGGDASRLGIGAMTDQRWQSLFEDLSAVGLLDSQLDYQQAYTLDYVNKGVEYYQLPQPA
ncbi:MAG: ABC transporter substrate-binding protein [Cyanobacteriota bacterium]|nr:ABC transporter substrate-binding protein [Cyanobacteriota bacterium]